MKNINKILILAVLMAIVASNSLYAAKRKGETKVQSTKNANCLPASSSNELTINNVRAYLETNGTMWFREVAEYEIPKGSGKTSMFCAALWIGGLDIDGQLKLAAVRFRQRGDDFWTGPLSTIDATVSQETCSQYDRFFKVTRAQVEAHIAAFETGVKDPSYSIPAVFEQWPAHGDESIGQSRYLAPFRDVDGDGVYDPSAGDYPYYDLDNELCPWTEANIQAAKDTLLPRTPEDVYYNPDKRETNGMIYADHVLKGDETLFWIFNDKGNDHTESGGIPIGLEIRGQAFAFATNDELNNMTFYSYEIINRSSFALTNTYFSQWVDPDLGYANDDYVGCDVARGLGYCYNGKDVDGSGQTWAYGAQPPAVGVDFFQGPYIDPDGRDNPKFWIDSVSIDPNYCNNFVYDNMLDTFVDQMAINGVNFGDDIIDNERFGMRRFVYHNNDGSNRGDPVLAVHYYNMLQGKWKNTLKMTYGGNAEDTGGPECDFMFPGTTDPCYWGTKGVKPTEDFGIEGWTEKTVNNEPYDRRFMQSAGPFTLQSGAVNYITVGMPWARATSGGAWASVELLKVADDKCQSLFENCFKVLDGPDAPDVTYRELENEIILYLSNDDKISNNHNEKYVEVDQQIPQFTTITTIVPDTLYHADTIDDGLGNITIKETVTYTQREETTQRENDREYKFEGYLIYQLKNKDVSVTDLANADLARIVRQCDIQNGASKLINFIYNEALQSSVPTEMVNGNNTGISHSFSLTEDAFAVGSRQLVNHKVYYYMVLAYAYNEYEKYDISGTLGSIDGQKFPFLAGRKNIKVISCIPHKTMAEGKGTVLNSQYGTQPMITRIEGQGNGGYFLDMTKKSHDKIMAGAPWTTGEVEYQENRGPLGIKVVDPLKVRSFDYEIRFIEESMTDVTDTTGWILEIVNATDDEIRKLGLRNANGDTTNIVTSNMAISVRNEQLILPLGISISINNYPFAIHQMDLEDYVNEHNSYGNMIKYAQVNFLGATMEYSDPSRPWLSGVRDTEGNVPNNWIRSGQQNAGPWTNSSSPVKGDYERSKTEDYFSIFTVTNPQGGASEVRGFKDPNQQFEKVLSGLWAPYVLASAYHSGPQAKYITPDNPSAEPTPVYYESSSLHEPTYYPGFNQTMTNLYSVDIVFTSDESKWTRAIVLEAGENAPGGALRHEPKKMPSVGKNGKPDGSGTGMG